MPSGLAPWPFTYQPRPGEFAALFNTLSHAINTAGPALVGTATTTQVIGVPASKTIYVAGASVQGTTIFTGSAAVTALLQKKSGATVTSLAAAFDLTAALSTAGFANIPITATDPNATLAPGDVLQVAIGCAGTVGPATADLRVVVEVAIIS